MAQMTPARLLDRVLGRLTASGRKLVQLAYVNTSLAVKAVVGRYGGAVCTSANAEKMMNWAFRQGEMCIRDRNWRVDRLGKIELTLLRLAVFEMLYRADVPPKVAINEALELSTRFGDAKAKSFINGILDAAIKAQEAGTLTVAGKEMCIRDSCGSAR